MFYRQLTINEQIKSTRNEILRRILYKSIWNEICMLLLLILIIYF